MAVREIALLCAAPLLFAAGGPAPSSHVERTVKETFYGGAGLWVRVIETSDGLRGLHAYQARGRLVETLRDLRDLQFPIVDRRESEPKLHWSDKWSPASGRYQLDFAFDGQARSLFGREALVVTPVAYVDDTPFASWQPNSAGRSYLPADTEDTQVEINLWRGQVLRDIPEAWAMTVPGASARVDYTTKGERVTVHIRLARDEGWYDRNGYDAIRHLYQSLDGKAKRGLALERPNWPNADSEFSRPPPLN